MANTLQSAQKAFLGSGAPAASSVGLINLGCARNIVDSQMILDRIKRKGHPIVDVQSADIAIVNTCAFIEAARQESVDVILDLIELKQQGRLKKVIVAGCLAQRYGRQLVEELKGVDAFVGALALDKDKFSRQVSLTPQHFAYVKICESCYNRCSFCAIPKIKGRFNSRPIESVLDEVMHLDRRGVRELNIVGQDITAYGIDIYKQFSLARLLREIASTTRNVRWIRLLYAFPAHVTDELIDVIATEPKICKYIDMPLQHISDSMLRAMNRGLYRQGTLTLLDKIRARIPQASLRTTFIVGFPGESEEDFAQLVDFIEDIRFHRMGCFLYSKEENTAAAGMPGHVPAGIKKKRLNTLMKRQQAISKERLLAFVGRRLTIMIDEPLAGQSGVFVGRTEFDAPEVDGMVYVHSARTLEPGDFVEVNITDAYEYDLVGEQA